MKINGQYPKPTASERTVQGPGKKGDAQAAKQAQGAQVTAKKSVTSELAMTKIRNAVDATPDMDMDKVKALKERIKNGSYQVDANKLAGNLLKDSAIEDV